MLSWDHPRSSRAGIASVTLVCANCHRRWGNDEHSAHWFAIDEPSRDIGREISFVRHPSVGNSKIKSYVSTQLIQVLELCACEGVRLSYASNYWPFSQLPPISCRVMSSGNEVGIWKLCHQKPHVLVVLFGFIPNWIVKLQRDTLESGVSAHQCSGWELGDAHDEHLLWSILIQGMAPAKNRWWTTLKPLRLPVSKISTEYSECMVHTYVDSD